jgi:hypothetical protein
MCGRFNLPGLFQGGVAKRPIGQQLRLVAQILRLFEKALLQRFCLLENTPHGALLSIGGRREAQGGVLITGRSQDQFGVARMMRPISTLR